MPRVAKKYAPGRRSLAIAAAVMLCAVSTLVGAQEVGAPEDATNEPEESTMSAARANAFDHAPWTAVLSKFVDDRGLVDYEGLSRDRAVFDRYIRSIEAVSPASHPQRFPTTNDSLAYYLNAYNAHVFDGVLDRGPEKKSVWRGLISGLNFFVRLKIEVGGRTTNLKKLEENVILKTFKDPRVHAALNCASIGCPRLPQEAFLPDRLDEQLDAAMREWANDPRHVEVDAAARNVGLNKIFDWFEGDFLGYEKRQGTADPTQIDYINRFRDADRQIPRDFSISFLPYDKGINDQ
ncbi:MAG: DUF547 domain-containing protein [Acidobacteriota bacterium]